MVYLGILPYKILCTQKYIPFHHQRSRLPCFQCIVICKCGHNHWEQSYYKNIEIRFHNRIKPNRVISNFYLKCFRLYLIILTFSPQNCKTCTKNWDKHIFSQFSVLTILISQNWVYFTVPEFVFHNSFFSQNWETKSDFWDSHNYPFIIY